MEEHVVRILDIEPVTHDVRRFRVEKPAGYSFVPGQATDVSVNSPALRKELRPFTFTCLTTDPWLEFTIKIYPARNGVTKALGDLKAGDELILHDVWGAIHYKEKGVFIAGGAGVTPFIAIFRDLMEKDELEGNTLIFANKTQADIILEDEFTLMLGKSFINILSDEDHIGYYHGFLNDDFLRKVVPEGTSSFYLCGPPPMMDAVQSALKSMGIGAGAVTVEL
jgi:ferredoxin-NADP reductase